MSLRYQSADREQHQLRGSRLEKEASQKKQAQYEYQGVNYNFDKTHEIIYPQ